jgi:hypothetical protein
MKEQHLIDRYSPRRELRPLDVVIRVLIVGLALGTSYIHSTLGGMLFTLNAIGYAVAAFAMVAPLGIASRFRWVVRLGLIGYAATTIVGWYLFGPRYDVAYLTKAIEIALIALLAVDFFRRDGNPITVIRRNLLATPGGRTGAARS